MTGRGALAHRFSISGAGFLRGFAVASWGDTSGLCAHHHRSQQQETGIGRGNRAPILDSSINGITPWRSRQVGKQ